MLQIIAATTNLAILAETRCGHLAHTGALISPLTKHVHGHESYNKSLLLCPNGSRIEIRGSFEVGMEI